MNQHACMAWMSTRQRLLSMLLPLFLTWSDRAGNECLYSRRLVPRDNDLLLVLTTTTNASRCGTADYSKACHVW